METDEGVEECQMLLPGQSRSGVLRLEAVSSALLSAPRPLAVMHSRQAVAELRQLECDVAAGALTLCPYSLCIAAKCGTICKSFIGAHWNLNHVSENPAGFCGVHHTLT